MLRSSVIITLMEQKILGSHKSDTGFYFFFKSCKTLWVKFHKVPTTGRVCESACRPRHKTTGKKNHQRGVFFFLAHKSEQPNGVIIKWNDWYTRCQSLSGVARTTLRVSKRGKLWARSTMQASDWQQPANQWRLSVMSGYGKMSRGRNDQKHSRHLPDFRVSFKFNFHHPGPIKQRTNKQRTYWVTPKGWRRLQLGAKSTSPTQVLTRRHVKQLRTEWFSFYFSENT